MSNSAVEKALAEIKQDEHLVSHSQGGTREAQLRLFRVVPRMRRALEAVLRECHEEPVSGGKFAFGKIAFCATIRSIIKDELCVPEDGSNET